MEPIIKVDNVSMCFNLSTEKHESLKEYLLAMVQGRLQYDEFYALKDVSLDIMPGDFYGLVGLNGSGKSTLLKLILREETPTEGRVLVNGQDVARLRRRKIPYLRRQMGIIFQDFRLIPTMTVYENIAFAMHVTNIGHKQIKERVNYMLELVHLEDKAKVYPDLLSGGEQQRIALARACLLYTSPSPRD